MRKVISSAGLLYVYIYGYKEDERIYLQQINSYQCIGNEFYNRIKNVSELTEDKENSIHIYGIVGMDQKVGCIYSIFEEGIKANYQKIMSDEEVEISSNELDDIGNIFYRCVQEVYYERLAYLPKQLCFKLNNGIGFCGIYGSKVQSEEIDSIADEIVGLWLEREVPMLSGQQLMMKSFFLRDFVGRKMIAALPESETGLWRMIFEGGHQLNLSENYPYMKETLHPDDLGSFCLSNIQSMLMNPIYAYGKWFQPSDICEEWHKAFLYLCAVSEKDWSFYDIRKVYEKFLEFLEENICWIMQAETIIPKEQYVNILLVHIKHYRSYFR